MRKILLIITIILFSFNSFAGEKNDDEVLYNIRECLSFHVENETILPAKSDKEFKLYKDHSEKSKFLGKFPVGTVLQENRINSVSKVLDRGEYQIDGMLNNYYNEYNNYKFNTLYKYDTLDNKTYYFPGSYYWKFFENKDRENFKVSFFSFRGNNDGKFRNGISIEEIKDNVRVQIYPKITTIRESKFEDWYYIKLKDQNIKGYSKTCPLDNKIKHSETLENKPNTSKTKEYNESEYLFGKNLYYLFRDLYSCTIPKQELCCEYDIDGNRIDKNGKKCTVFYRPINTTNKSITLYKEPSKSSEILGNFPENTKLETISEKPSIRFKKFGKYIALHNINSDIQLRINGYYIDFSFPNSKDESIPIIKKGDIIEKIIGTDYNKVPGVILNNKNIIHFHIDDKPHKPNIKEVIDIEEIFMPITKTESELWYFIEIEGTNLKGYIDGCPVDSNSYINCDEGC